MIEVFGLMFAKILRKEFFLSYKTNRQKQELKKSTYFIFAWPSKIQAFPFLPTTKKKGEK